MSFKFELNDGTEHEFPHAADTGKLKAALRKLRKMPKETDEEAMEYSLTLIETLLGEEGADIDAYDKVDPKKEGEFIKKFFGGLDPKA